MIGDQMQQQVKRGCYIVTCDPSKRLIEAKIQREEIVPVNAYSFSPVFRWPKVGEKWIIREENGSWFLDSIWEDQEPALDEKGAPVPIQPGDTVITASSGTVWKNVDGQLEPLTQASKFSLIEKYVKQPGPFVEGQAYVASTEFVTLALISHGGTPENKTLYIDGVEVAKIQFQGSIIPFTVILPKGQSWEIRGGSTELKSVAYAFFPQ